MKVCSSILSPQVVPWGDVRLCCFMRHDYVVVGNLAKNTMQEILRNEKVREIFDRISAEDYSICDPTNCRYLTSGRMDMPIVEIDKIPECPESLSLSYDKFCNYKCVFCGIHTREEYNKVTPEIELCNSRIEENLKSVLPKLKRISAQGCGELFMSKNVLKQLASWKPLSPPEEISVRLETNGSLFDEQHWRQIENLGQYNLRVDITVLSFDEHTYQTLSGVKYPISRIEDNLRFVKSLREKNVINHLQIATVVQDRNFRTLPAFVKRCIEEFGADSVRLRPIVPYSGSPDWNWFSSIRNRYHPYYQEYLEILKDPILRHPKVQDWGVFKSTDIPSPYMQTKQEAREVRQGEGKILREMFEDGSVLENLEKDLTESGGKVIIHGAGSLGVSVAKTLSERGKIEVSYITDFKQSGDFLGIPIVNLPPPPRRFTKKTYL